MAMMATTQTTSRRLKPSSVPTPSPGPAGDIRRRSCATFLSVRSARNDVIGTVLTWGAIGIRLAPWIVGDAATFQIGTVPRGEAAAALHQHTQTLRAQRISPGVKVEEVKCARKALDLDLGGFDL